MSSYKFLIAVIVVVLVGAGGWFAYKSHSGDSLANLSAAADAKLTDEQVRELISRISRFMVVPADEKPSVVIIHDAATLAQQQTFYRDAKDGDILIVYSARAIIYDVKADKLVNVGPIVKNDATPTPIVDSTASASATITPSATPGIPEKVTVDVRNGSATAGLAGAMASTLKKNTWVTIGQVGDAKGSYTKTTIVDLSSGKKPNAVAALEKQLGVTAVTTLPKGEAASTADVLVIVTK